MPLVLIGLMLRQVDISAGVDRVAAIGPLAAVAFLPALLVLSFDALGWKLLLARDRRRNLPFLRLLAGRLCGEAVSQSLPSAGLAGEAASAWYLSRHTPLSLGESIGSLAARRVRIAQGHGVVLALASLVTLATRGIPGRLAAFCALSALGLWLA